MISVEHSAATFSCWLELGSALSDGDFENASLFGFPVKLQLECVLEESLQRLTGLRSKTCRGATRFFQKGRHFNRRNLRGVESSFC